MTNKARIQYMTDHSAGVIRHIVIKLEQDGRAEQDRLYYIFLPYYFIILQYQYKKAF